MKPNWEIEFDKIYKEATGGQNIVGDLIIKDFIRKLIYNQKEKIKRKIHYILGEEQWEKSKTIEELEIKLLEKL